MHAVLQFVLSGAQQEERIVAVLDERSSAFAKSLVDHVEEAKKAERYRSMPGEDFVRRGPLEPERLVAEIRRAVESWRGRPSTRVVRVVVDFRFIFGALGGSGGVTRFSHGIRKLTTELPVVCLCLLFTEQVPHGGLRAFLESFSRFIATDPILSTDGRTRGVEPSKELDAALDRLLLSDETVVAETAGGTARRLDYLSAKTFLRISGDHIVILDRELRIEYIETALSHRLSTASAIERGASFSTFFLPAVYSRVVAAFQHIASHASSEPRSSSGIVILPVVGRFGEELLFEASVSAVIAYERVFGFVCVLRDTPRDGEKTETAVEGSSVAATAFPTTGPTSTAATATGEKRAAAHPGGSLLKRAPGEAKSARAWTSWPAVLTHSCRLTMREVEVLELTLNGERIADIADLLSIAPVTVKKHRANGYRKLGVRDRFELHRLASSFG